MVYEKDHSIHSAIHGVVTGAPKDDKTVLLGRPTYEDLARK